MCQSNIVRRACLQQPPSLSSVSGCYYWRSGHPVGECHTLASHQRLTRCLVHLYTCGLARPENLRGAEGRVEEAGP